MFCLRNLDWLPILFFEWIVFSFWLVFSQIWLLDIHYTDKNNRYYARIKTDISSLVYYNVMWYRYTGPVVSGATHPRSPMTSRGGGCSHCRILRERRRWETGHEESVLYFIGAQRWARIFLPLECYIGFYYGLEIRFEQPSLETLWSFWVHSRGFDPPF